MNEDKKEVIEKSTDSLIDEFFMDITPESEEPVEKAESKLMPNGSDAGPSKETADEGEQPKKAKSEKEGERGRPKEVSDVPQTDNDGNRAKGYDHIQQENKKTPEISPKGTMVKSEDTVEISKEDYEFLQKAKESQKEEELKKAREEQADLIKSAVSEVMSGMRAENDELKKSLEEQANLIKSIANRPQRRKSVDNIQALEKAFESEEDANTPKQESFSKSEMMDVAEELVKAGQLTVEQAIELDDTGYIFDPNARKVLENALRKK